LCDPEGDRIVAKQRGLYRLSDGPAMPCCSKDMFKTNSNFRDAGEIGIAVKWRILDIFFRFDKCDKLVRQRLIKNPLRIPGN
jgi:hypothetical protein